AQQELLRLSPPSPGDGPVIQLTLLTLIASSAVPSSGAQKGVQKAILPQMEPFPKKVHVEGAVYDALDFDSGKQTPVPSTVTFRATALDTIADGVFASFSTTAM